MLLFQFLFSLGCMDLNYTLDPKKRALQNYGQQMKILAKEYDVSWTYLMALTVLECSGRNPCAHRFEGHVFDSLKEVQDQEKESYSNIFFTDLKGVDNAEIGHLATSWGPFQIMGYHSVHMETEVDNFHNELALETGVEWIDSTYGWRLRNESYEDAFHMHNTGIPFPSKGPATTHDPEYVYNGLWYMEYFSQYEDDFVY